LGAYSDAVDRYQHIQYDKCGKRMNDSYQTAILRGYSRKSALSGGTYYHMGLNWNDKPYPTYSG